MLQDSSASYPVESSSHLAFAIGLYGTAHMVVLVLWDSMYTTSVLLACMISVMSSRFQLQWTN